MSNIDLMQSELEMLEMMTVGYVGSLLRTAKEIPADKWNWSFSERTPTPREICEHTFVWLWCDRQQLTVADQSQHLPTPELPSDREVMLALLQEEAEDWRRMIRAMTPDKLLEIHKAFDGDQRNVRGFLFHIGQHVICKVGQISMLYFELGLDGGEPYSAPFPNEIYGFEGSDSWPKPRTYHLD